ncbi:hypothetical protein R3P38DRAFT_2846219 [Favolaschia claudopus]|uniref:Uncharacterized protein n=1 Tax=Favolaschia claudopus TaxID=2862362 RepID=A0AAW0DUB2_9AGAR
MDRLSTPSSNGSGGHKASNPTQNAKIPSDRAKADHLIRQLQLRLQYARLKVDHGWQQQRLNEVENLYFCQQRKQLDPVVGSTKSISSEYPATAILNPPPPDSRALADEQRPNPSYSSSLSFKVPPASQELEESDKPSPSVANPTTPLHDLTEWVIEPVTPSAPVERPAVSGVPASSQPQTLSQTTSTAVPVPATSYESFWSAHNGT